MIFQYLKLRFFTEKNVKTFSFENYKSTVYVSKVYDGDTITIVFNYKGIIFRKSCRLLGIDTPEIKTKNLKEKRDAICARNYLRDQVLNKYKYVKFHKMDKYGRPLIEIFHKKHYLFNKSSINQKLVDNKMAIPYFGGKKEEFI